MDEIILYKNHGSNIGSWSIWTEGATVRTEAFKKLGGNPTVSQYQAEGKNIGRANETTPQEQAELEALSKARLKLDKGYVRTLEEAQAPATNSMNLLMPMLATPIDKVKPEKIDWYTSYVQPKLDGHRALWKDGVLYSRQGKALEIPHIIEQLADSPMRDLHLDGELYIHGKPLQDLSRLIKKQTVDSLDLEYHIYDQIKDDGFYHRYMEISDLIVDQWRDNIHLVETSPVADLEAMTAFHTFYRGQGYEGTMLRFGGDHYAHGKRSRTLLKVKEFHDAEFRVVGYEEGKPYVKADKTYRVPVWICETLMGGLRFNVTAHGTMVEKDYQWENRDEYLRMNLTVKYHYKSRDGIPQLPVALRWREDV